MIPDPAALGTTAAAPAFVAGVPGGPELLVILLLALLFFGPLVALAIGYLSYSERDGDEAATEERVAELEREVEELRAETGDREE